MIASIALCLAAAQAKTVTFTHPAAHSSVVLAALGEELGMKMEPSGSVNDGYFLVHFDDVPVQRALDMVAETLSARWVKKGGTNYLERRPSDIADAKRERIELLEAGIEEYLEEKARVASDWSRLRAVNVLRPFLQSDGSLDGESAARALAANGPCRELVDEFVRAVGAKKLSRTPEGSPVVYRWIPRKGEQRIPSSLRSKAQDLVGSITIFGAALQGLGVPALGDFDLPAEVRLAGAQGLTPDAWAFRVQNFGRRLYVVMIASGRNPSPYGSASINAKGREFGSATIPDLEGVYQPSPLATAIYNRKVQASLGSAHRLSEDDEMAAEIMAWFEGGLSPDPTHLMAGEAILQIAEAAGYSIVALVYDGSIAGYFLQNFRQKPLRDVLAALGQFMHVSIDGESKTITIGSPSGIVGSTRIDREATAVLALRVYNDGWARMEPLAIYAVSCDNGFSWQTGRMLSSVLQPERYGPMQATSDPVRRALRIFGSLPKAARKMAHDDWLSFPVSDLPKKVRDLVYDAYSERTFSPAQSSSVAYRWTLYPTVGMSSDRVGKRAELDRAYLDVRVEQAQVLTARDHRDGGVVYASGLLSPKEAAQYIYNALSGEQAGQVDYRVLAEITAERLTLRLRTRSNGDFIVMLTTDSANSETIYLPHNQISSTLGKELKQELAKLSGGGL